MDSKYKYKPYGNDAYKPGIHFFVNIEVDLEHEPGKPENLFYDMENKQPVYLHNGQYYKANLYASTGHDYWAARIDSYNLHGEETTMTALMNGTTVGDTVVVVYEGNLVYGKITHIDDPDKPYSYGTGNVLVQLFEDQAIAGLANKQIRVYGSMVVKLTEERYKELSKNFEQQLLSLKIAYKEMHFFFNLVEKLRSQYPWLGTHEETAKYLKRKLGNDWSEEQAIALIKQREKELDAESDTWNCL